MELHLLVIFGTYMKIIKIIIIVLAVIIALYVAKLFLFSKNANADLGKFISERVELTDISITISATGTLDPEEQVEVGTQVSGDISKIYVDFNSLVKKGQVIAELDKSKLKATLAQAEIAYKSAQTDFKYKESIYNRQRKLANTNSASAVELETAEYNMNSAALAVESRKNEVEEAKLNLSYATIKSPISGVVLKRAVDVGQTVAASMSTPTLFVIAKDLSQMKVMANVDEADIGQVRPGQSVEFYVDAFDNETFYGTVQEVRLNPTTTSNVVTYTVVITANNPEQKLLPGMTATCTIITQQVKDAITVSVKALKFMPQKKANDIVPKMPNKNISHNAPQKIDEKESAHVWVNIMGNATFCPVKIGISDGVNVQIVDGLKAGDSVIVAQEFLTENATGLKGKLSPFMPGPPKKKSKR